MFGYVKLGKDRLPKFRVRLGYVTLRHIQSTWLHAKAFSQSLEMLHIPSIAVMSLRMSPFSLFISIETPPTTPLLKFYVHSWYSAVHKRTYLLLYHIRKEFYFLPTVKNGRHTALKRVMTVHSHNFEDLKNYASCLK